MDVRHLVTHPLSLTARPRALVHTYTALSLPLPACASVRSTVTCSSYCMYCCCRSLVPVRRQHHFFFKLLSKHLTDGVQSSLDISLFKEKHYKNHGEVKPRQTKVPQGLPETTVTWK